MRKAIVLIAYAMVVIVMTLLLIQRSRFVSVLIAQADEADDEMIQMLERARRQMGVEQGAALRLGILPGPGRIGEGRNGSGKQEHQDERAHGARSFHGGP